MSKKAPPAKSSTKSAPTSKGDSAGGQKAPPPKYKPGAGVKPC